MFIGRVNNKHIFFLILTCLIPASIFVGIAMKYYDKENHTCKPLPAMLTVKRVPTWIGRIQTFLYSNKEDSNEKLYQINQSKIAIASGGWFGLGPGNSRARNFLPHSYSDFIYSIILEEYGLFGGVFVLFIYLFFLFRCVRLCQKCPYAFGTFLALALSFTLVIQAIAHMGVNVNIFPNTGMTLPLMSMGGSSFLFTCLSIGIILSVARNVEQLEGNAAVEKAEAVTDEKSVAEKKENA
jgi:cell division protein FtsW